MVQTALPQPGCMSASVICWSSTPALQTSPTMALQSCWGSAKLPDRLHSLCARPSSHWTCAGY